MANKLAEPHTKVLFLVDMLRNTSAGTEGQLIHLMRSLLAQGHDVELALLRDDHTAATLREQGVGVTVLDIRRMTDPRSWWKLASYAWSKRDYEIVHIWMNDSAIMGPPVFKAAGFKVVVSRRDIGFWYTKTKLPLLRMSAKCVDAVVANASAVAEKVIRAEHFDADKVHVIYNGLYDNKKIPDSRTATKLMPEGARGIVVLANLRALKRIDLAIKAFAAAHSRSERHYLVCIGDYSTAVDLKNELSELAKKMGVAERVLFPGSIPNAAHCLPEFEIGLLFSDTEGFPNAILEYMQAGMPVIATNVGGVSELVVEGETGFIVEAGDVDSAALRLQQLSEDPELRGYMSQNGQLRCEKVFAGAHMTANHLRLYHQLSE